jgi:hypothetical protein
LTLKTKTFALTQKPTHRFDCTKALIPQQHKNNDKVLVASRGVLGINLGVFLVPNTPYSRFFMEMMAEERYKIERRAPAA